jgi:hypothetical protein
MLRLGEGLAVPALESEICRLRGDAEADVVDADKELSVTEICMFGIEPGHGDPAAGTINRVLGGEAASTALARLRCAWMVQFAAVLGERTSPHSSTYATIAAAHTHTHPIIRSLPYTTDACTGPPPPLPPSTPPTSD